MSWPLTCLMTMILVLDSSLGPTHCHHTGPDYSFGPGHSLTQTMILILVLVFSSILSLALVRFLLVAMILIVFLVLVLVLVQVLVLISPFQNTDPESSFGPDPILCHDTDPGSCPGPGSSSVSALCQCADCGSGPGPDSGHCYDTDPDFSPCLGPNSLSLSSCVQYTDYVRYVEPCFRGTLVQADLDNREVRQPFVVPLTQPEV